jgi:hypothetical protein
MMRVQKNVFDVGDVVSIVFEDHSEGDQHITFEVFGVVMRKDRKSVVVGSFVYPNCLDQDENTVVYTILRATIQSVNLLRKLTSNLGKDN